jgi:hypothetical protein
MCADVGRGRQVDRYWHTLLGDSATGPLMFNITTNSWIDPASPTVVACGKEWDSYEDSPMASVSVEQGFVSSYPDCASAAA